MKKTNINDLNKSQKDNQSEKKDNPFNVNGFYNSNGDFVDYRNITSGDLVKKETYEKQKKNAEKFNMNMSLFRRRFFNELTQNDPSMASLLSRVTLEAKMKGLNYVTNIIQEGLVDDSIVYKNINTLALFCKILDINARKIHQASELYIKLICLLTNIDKKLLTNHMDIIKTYLSDEMQNLNIKLNVFLLHKKKWIYAKMLITFEAIELTYKNFNLIKSKKSDSKIIWISECNIRTSSDPQKETNAKNKPPTEYVLRFLDHDQEIFICLNTLKEYKYVKDRLLFSIGIFKIV